MRTIHCSYNFYSSIKTVGATVLGGLWAFESDLHETCPTDQTAILPSEPSHASHYKWKGGWTIVT